MSNLDTLQVDDSIQLERQGSILTLWLNRPESRNAMSLNMVNAIQQVFAHIAD
jgi:isohexenylglutaconyl-CoA hydratase